MLKKSVFLYVCLSLILPISGFADYDRIERLKSRVKRGVDYYRDGRFTISRLTKQPLSGRSTLIRGLITNDTTKRAVSVQLEITCYNAAGDLLDTQLLEIDYLNSRDTQPFQATFRENAGDITLYEALVQDVIWDHF